MFQGIFIFIIFLGPLVFFHELGHFLFARFFGVRVEVFSIGFGPKIIKFKKGFTEYAVSLIPLGGYVKMFGDDPLNKEAIPEDLRDVSFTYKGKWARFWIVMGGPLANFILAFFIFWTLLLSGERLPEIRLGNIPYHSNFYDLGFRSGDTLKKVNGSMIYSPTDIILDGKNTIQTLTVRRLGKDQKLTINSEREKFFEEFSKYPGLLRKPIVIDSLGKMSVISFDSKSPSLEVSFGEIAQTDDGEKEIYFYEYKDGKVEEHFYQSVSVNFGDENALEKLLASRKYRPLDLSIKSVNLDSPADKAGLKSGDVVLSLNETPIYGFEQLRSTLQKTTGESIELSFWREGKVNKVDIRPELKNINGKEVKLIGVYQGGEFIKIRYLETKGLGLIAASSKALTRTLDTFSKTLSSFKKLFTGGSSFKSIGGPIAIGKVATDSFNASLSYFFQLMALISVNLGIINLFPIPVLDGGHIVFIFIELFNGGPLSKRKMEIAQQVGLSLLLLLMFGAIYNDIARQFL